jgi:arabinose-5-phosphate isomerase
MITDDLPTLTANRSMQDCVILLARKRGTVAVVNEVGALEGVITAGDLTRLMNGNNEFLHQPVKAVMNPQPKTASADELAAAAMHRMEQYGIMALPVLDGGNKVVGMVHLHDLMRAGNA